jgi:hypothetical protein
MDRGFTQDDVLLHPRKDNGMRSGTRKVARSTKRIFTQMRFGVNLCGHDEPRRWFVIGSGWLGVIAPTSCAYYVTSVWQNQSVYFNISPRKRLGRQGLNGR